MERMKNKNLIFVTLLMSLLFVGFVTADATVSITTTDNTEFNTLTPTVNVNVTAGNCSSYYLNITANGVVVVDTQAIANITDTAFVMSTLAASTSYTYNATVWNYTCDSGISNSSADKTLEVNAQPSVTSVTQSTYGNLLNGNTLTWTNVWADQNSTGTDSVTAYVCKTDAFTTSCTGGEWGHSSAETDNSTAVSYTVLTSLSGGQKNYYVYLLDDNSYASSSTSGTFTVSKPIEDETYFTTALPADGEPLDIPIGAIVALVIGVIVAVLVFKKK